MKIEIPFLALVLIGTSLLARIAAQGVEQALFSTVIDYCLNVRRRKLRSGPRWLVDLGLPACREGSPLDVRHGFTWRSPVGIPGRLEY